MLPGSADLSSRLNTILLVPQRVLCLKITCGTVADLSIMCVSCSSLVRGIQFIKTFCIALQEDRYFVQIIIV